MKALYYIDVAVWAVLAVRACRRWDHSPMSTSCLLIAFTAFALWLLARHQLGASFKIKAEAHSLIRHGLYSKLRNPIYTFAFIAFESILASMHAWIAMAVFAFFYLGQLARIKREQKVLEEAFGDEYRAYKAQTWF